MKIRFRRFLCYSGTFHVFLGKFTLYLTYRI